MKLQIPYSDWLKATKKTIRSMHQTHGSKKQGCNGIKMQAKLKVPLDSQSVGYVKNAYVLLSLQNIVIQVNHFSSKSTTSFFEIA